MRLMVHPMPMHRMSSMLPIITTDVRPMVWRMYRAAAASPGGCRCRVLELRGRLFKLEACVSSSIFRYPFSVKLISTPSVLNYKSL